MRGQSETEVRIRPFVDADVHPLTDLLHEAYAELGALGLNFTAVDQDAATTRRRARAGRCWVAVQGDRIVGTATVSMPLKGELLEQWPSPGASGTAWLNQLAVAPRLRGTGVARRLFETGLAWARSQGAHTLGLDTAAPARHLVDLYTRWGFTPQGTIRWAGKQYDSVIMTRPVEVIPSGRLVSRPDPPWSARCSGAAPRSPGPSAGR